MWVSKFVCLFFVYSVYGWIYESVFCTVKGEKWENRGFLYGPLCPIYGAGCIGISIVEFAVRQTEFRLTPFYIFIISVIGSAILEYVTSWVLEKLFHALWWDYSKLPLNIHGRVSLFTSIGFGFAGVLVFYYIIPFTEGMIVSLPDIMIEILSLIMMAIFSVDITLTATALISFDRTVIRIQDEFNRNMEKFVADKVEQSHRIKEELVEKKNSIVEHANAISGLAKASLSGVQSFRHRNEQTESIKNQLLQIIGKQKDGK